MQVHTVSVNGTAISQFDFINAMQSYAMELYRKPADQLNEEETEKVQEIAIERIIARELIYQGALAEGIVATDEQIAAETAKVQANFPTVEEFYATLEKAGVTQDDYYRMLRQDISVNMMTDKISQAPEPGEEEKREFYAAHPDNMRKPRQVRASHILVKCVSDEDRPAALEKINAIKEQLLPDGSNFAELALANSVCPSREKGGDLGFFGTGSMVKEFEEAAFALKPGEISDVVQTPFGYHLIKVHEYQEEQKLAYEEVADQIASFLKEQEGARMLYRWVEERKEQADIQLVPVEEKPASC